MRVSNLNALNRELLLRLHQSGIALPSYTTLSGNYTLCACITNNRTQRSDLDMMGKEVVRIGNELSEEGFLT